MASAHRRPRRPRSSTSSTRRSTLVSPIPRCKHGLPTLEARRLSSRPPASASSSPTIPRSGARWCERQTSSQTDHRHSAPGPIDMEGASSSCGSVRIDRLDPWLGRPGGGTSECADEVTLSGEGAKGRPPSRVRSAGTKARTRAGRTRETRAELERTLAEALQQQTATSEILRVIRSSPSNVQPVFDAVAESAARLCESFDSAVWRRESDRLLLVAHHGAIPQTGSASFLPLVRGTVGGRSVLDGRTVHIADIQTKGDEFPNTSENARRQGYRTILSVPLMREGAAIGTIVLRRTEARLFSERQIALLQTFADQAVIAIENVRLFETEEQRTRELSEALEQQTATAEVLGVISSSPGELEPVFQAMLE